MGSSDAVDVAAGRMLDEAMSVGEGDVLLVVMDLAENQQVVGRAVAAAARRAGAQVVEVTREGAGLLGEEPPRPVAAAMAASDVTLFVAEKATPAHSNAWDEMVEAGVRVFGIVGLSPEYFARPLDLQALARVRQRSGAVAACWTGGSTGRISTTFGTDLTWSLVGSRGTDAGKILLPDYAEAATAPAAGTAEGVIVVDACVDTWGSLLAEPLVITVEKGAIVDIQGSRADVARLRAIVDRDPGAPHVGEIAVGTSDLVPAQPSGGRHDFAIAGTAHVAFGRNTYLGGSVVSGVHLDALMTQATVHVDDVMIVDGGSLRV